MKIIIFLFFSPLFLHAATFDSSIASLVRLNKQTSMAVNTQGVVDLRFGQVGGIVLPLIPTTDSNYAAGIVLQSNGTVVVGGYAVKTGFLYYSALSFLPTTASLNTAFGRNGYSLVPFTVIPSSFTGDTAFATILQPDGKCIVGGYSTTPGGNERFSLVRFTSTGSLDTTFGLGNGTNYITTSISGGDSDRMYTLCLQPDGKIITAGYTNNGESHYALARFTSAGVLDTSFGTGGKAYIAGHIAGGDTDIIYASGLQSTGKIIVAGTSNNGNGDILMSLARYTSTGALDTTFGGNGTGYTFLANIAGGLADQCNALIIQTDNKIVLAGSSEDNDSYSHFALARFTAQGTLDTTFGTNGKTFIPFLINNDSPNIINSIITQSDGKLLVGGYANSRTALARFSANGILDTTFGTNGTVFYPQEIGGWPQGASSIVITPAQNILASTGDNQVLFTQFVNFPSASQFDQQYAGQAGLLA